MTFKQQIFAFVKAQNRPCTRKEIVNFYCSITGKTPKGCGNLSEALCTPCINHGYLLQGVNCLKRIGYNKYIA